MPEQLNNPPRPVQLPAVLHIAGQAPCFGTIASLSSQGIGFDFQGCDPEQGLVGSKARLDFDFQDQHHACDSLIIHVQGQRALLSLREASPTLLAALGTVSQHNTPQLSRSLSALQKQHACHETFMASMQDVVDEFYRLLNQSAPLASHQPGYLERALTPLRPILVRQFTLAYPMYPESRRTQPASETQDPAQTVDMGQVDEWIQRTRIAQAITEAIQPLPEQFTEHYNAQLKRNRHHEIHPYHPDAVLVVLSDLIKPLNLSAEAKIRCYELMGQAFAKDARSLYQAMLDIMGEAPAEGLLPPNEAGSLAAWLKAYARPSGSADEASAAVASTTPIDDLTALLVRLSAQLEHTETHSADVTDSEEAASNTTAPSPGLLARDRIIGRFLAAATPTQTSENTFLLQPGSTSHGGFSEVLGRLADLDGPALEALNALLKQPPPIDPGPEKLPPSSQVRALMLQAQGLLQEYTLNGLTYREQPNHPAWSLINALEALHRGADDQGLFLDPALYKATNLAMQWLLEQRNTDRALEQVNTLLAELNDQLLAEHQARRQHHLDKLGTLMSAHAILDTDWCVIKREDVAIPYEVLGQSDSAFALLNRSATRLLEIPTDQLTKDVDHGLVEGAPSYNAPFLERTAATSLATSLGAVHTYTWKDPASGCLKRSALIDELERRLEHPVSEPPSFCALIEIPTMRPTLSSLPGDELTVMQTRSGELLRAMLEPGEHCGRLSDVTFLTVFSPQDPDRLASRLSSLKSNMEDLHPEWKMIGAAVPLLGDQTPPTPSDVLRRADQACAGIRQQAGFDLNCLDNVPPVSNQIEPLPFDSLYLRCQKIASFDDEVPAHYEILLGVSEQLVPSHTTQSFILMAEQIGRIHELDVWMLKSALEWMNAQATGLKRISGISLNLSGHTLSQSEHVDAVLVLLSQYPLLAEKLIFEITETAAIDNLDLAARSLRRLRTLGCRVALDDFGSGYSSYGYLRSLPLDYLKIDGTYIRQILTNKTDQALTASMVDVAHALGLKVIAEYVDSQATCSWLKNLGVDYVQGYWIHEPQRLDTLALH